MKASAAQLTLSEVTVRERGEVSGECSLERRWLCCEVEMVGLVGLRLRRTIYLLSSFD